MAGKYPKTLAVNNFIRAYYDTSVKGRSQWIADQLGWPRHVVNHRAGQLGLSKVKDRDWSDKDIDYLEKHMSKVAVAQIAQKLGRTQTAVKLKAKRLKMLKTKSEYTVNNLSICFGIDPHGVKRWIDNGWLKAAKRNTDRTELQGGDVYYIKESDVVDFIRHHSLEISLKKVDELWFLSLIGHALREGGKPKTGGDDGKTCDHELPGTG